MLFSIVIPLYNRPNEIRELLDSLCKQSYREFEVIIVEDGSSLPAEDIVMSYADKLDISYYFKPNEGQGFARNFGFQQAKGDYFIVFDSDIIVPERYLEFVNRGLAAHQWDAFGGPDAAHTSFTPIQKAISYGMTSPLTTGGIRGNKKHVGQFHPRSFNMAISRKVWESTAGYRLSRRSEDIEFSIRMIQQGFKVGLIPEAFVYHKRRTSFGQFYRQTFGFGKGRIDISMLYPEELKLVHALPAMFTLGVAALALLNILDLLLLGEWSVLHLLASIGNIFLSVYTVAILLHAWISTKEIKVAILAVGTSYVQLIAYGLGFLTNFVDRKLLNNNTSA